MITAEVDAQARALHAQYLDALGRGDMETVGSLFAYPAVLKGFLEDIVIATDATSLQSAYERLHDHQDVVIPVEHV